MISRRSFIGASAVGGAAALGAGQLLGGEALAAGLPAPADSGIEHVVVVMMENRSFDHFLGWLPGANGKQAGLRFQDRYGTWHSTYHSRRFNTCGFEDPDHSFEGGRVQLNGGRVDGWLRSGVSDTAAISYFTKPDLPFIGQAAAEWTTCDRYFSAIMAETYPNRFYLHAAQTDRLHNNTDQCHLPTIWDRLKAKGLSGTYFFSDIPFTALWYDHLLDISKPIGTFFAQAATGTLPQLSVVDPRFEDEASGTSNDDHPHADIRAGEVFLNQVYDAVRTSPAWDKTVLVVTFDEWGGFFDHVVPPQAPDAIPSHRLRGFRVPTIVISPRARRKHVAHSTYDHASILKMVEWRWGLSPLTQRDRYARNLAEVLDFVSPPKLTAPTFTVPPFVTAGCPSEDGQGSEFAEWPALRKLALDLGWELPA